VFAQAGRFMGQIPRQRGLWQGKSETSFVLWAKSAVNGALWGKSVASDRQSVIKTLRA
jgi:hypothetical protein